MASGVSLVTDGWICPVTKDHIQVITCEHPTTRTAVEVRPTIRSAESQSPVPGPVGAPVILSAKDMKPVIREVDGPVDGGAVDAPKIVSTEDLKPVIVKAEEE